MTYPYPGLIPPPPPKRKVFVSYHHGGDQAYYDALVNAFARSYELFYDNSLDRRVNSDNAEYVRWSISQNNITGSSCTIVLCGGATAGRKYVDWEIKATLDKQHGLLGLWLPTLPLLANGGTMKPERLQDNIDSGFAKWLKWGAIPQELLKATIEQAVNEKTALIINTRPMRQRNS